MQILGAYSMHAKLEQKTAIERINKFNELTAAWLKQKGANDENAEEGEFRSLTGDGVGLFSRIELETELGKLYELTLHETASNGDMFTTRVNLSHTNDRITVYATLGAAPKSVSVTDGILQPKCPSIIRSLIQCYEDWCFNEQDLPSGDIGLVSSEEEVLELCDELRWKERSLPIIVVSTDPDGIIWPNVADELATQLIGLADVVEIDRDAAWFFTNELGKASSCYLGAVRLYWPCTQENGRLRSQLWTSDRQVLFGKDETGKRRFLSMMRKTVSTAAALTISEPREMLEIRRASIKAKLENEGVEALKKQIEKLQERNAQLEAQISTTNASLANIRYEFEDYRARFALTSETEAENDENLNIGPPKKGETRFYKKTSTGGGVDRMVYRRKACNHNSWQPAFAGDQAEKGIAKLESSKNWKSLWKCNGCTGGGFWKVIW